MRDGSDGSTAYIDYYEQLQASLKLMRCSVFDSDGCETTRTSLPSTTVFKGTRNFQIAIHTFPSSGWAKLLLFIQQQCLISMLN